MAFPYTAVLDNFDRANGGVGANWSVAGGVPRIVSNQFATAVGGAASYMFYVPTGTIVHDEAYFDLVTLSSGWGSGPIVRAVDTSNFYFVGATAGIVSINKVVAGVSTNITGDQAATWTAGDKILFRAIGPQLLVYQYTAGAWVQTPILTATDSAVTAAGYIGALIVDGAAATSRWDNFGGGAIVQRRPRPISKNLARPVRLPGGLFS